MRSVTTTTIIMFYNNPLIIIGLCILFVLVFQISSLVNFFCEQKTSTTTRCIDCDRIPIHLTPYPLPGFVYLNSFPGSGNNWVIRQISAGSRLHYCSVYNASDSLYNFEKCSVTKSHYPYVDTDNDRLYRDQPKINLIRNPFDAVSAEIFRRQDEPEGFLIAFDYLSTSWATYMEFHFGKRFWTNTTRFQIWENNKTTRLVSNEMNPHQVVFFYEDVLQHQLESLENMFSFLKLKLREVMPSVPQSTKCAIESDKKVGLNTLRVRNKTQLFAMKVNENLVKEACKLWKPYWFEKKWGKCMDSKGRFYSREYKSKEVIGETSTNCWETKNMIGKNVRRLKEGSICVYTCITT